MNLLVFLVVVGAFLADVTQSVGRIEKKPAPLLSKRESADKYQRDDRDYQTSWLGKRDNFDYYRSPPFGKRDNDDDYRPSMFG
ncbi:MAG: hypothetical protein GY820_31970 [Gammaproteobacteria bacterium]|nr:hypothetical protein [Gammaproteobacteria bacterium]